MDLPFVGVNLSVLAKIHFGVDTEKPQCTAISAETRTYVRDFVKLGTVSSRTLSLFPSNMLHIK